MFYVALSGVFTPGNKVGVDMDMKICGSWLLGLIYLLMSSMLGASTLKEIAVESAAKYLFEGKVCGVVDEMAFLRRLSERQECEDSFHIVDIGKLADQLELWRQCLPRVTPHYAIKVNHDPIIVAILARLGMGFDCASQDEISQVLNLNVAPSQIIFAHPRKSITAIKYAVKAGIKLMTFDSIEELEKMLTFAPEGKYLLRIAVDDKHSAFPLSAKFGVSLPEARRILDEALSKNAPVIGIAFHVGSNCKHAESYKNAILNAAELFKYAADEWDVHFTFLDLGGGWPGNDTPAFKNISTVVAETIENYFDNTVTCIAEPGRYFVSQTTIGVMRILGKSSYILQDGGKRFAYYLSNGAYGSFLCSLFCRTEMTEAEWNFQPLFSPIDSKNLYSSLLWGPTCDSYDKLYDEIFLPELQSGDFIYTKNVGAYTYSMETRFNKITASKPYYIYKVNSARGPHGDPKGFEDMQKIVNVQKLLF